MRFCSSVLLALSLLVLPRPAPSSVGGLVDGPSDAILRAGAGAAEAQTREGGVPVDARIAPSAAPVPFGPGERAEYEVKLGPIGVGEGVMELTEVVPVRGRSSYHVTWQVDGGIPLARVRDRYESWFDVETLASRRFIQDIHQVRHENHRHFEIYPDERRWERRDAEGSGEMITDLPLDDVAFLYYARTLPLEVGERYELDRYFRADRNPVVLEVLRRETIEVPAGTFETIVVRPIIKTNGIFSEGGEAEVYFSDDEDRVVVMLWSKVPLVGSISLHLSDLRPGRPLAR